MSNKKKAEETRTSIDDLNDSLTSFGAKIQANRKRIAIATVIVAVVVIAILAWANLIRRPAIHNADVAAGMADIEMLRGNDSIALVKYQEAVELGKDGGNRAALMAAISLYQDGKYQEALDYVKEYSKKDDVIGAAAYSLEGDCYANLDKLPEAAEAFKKAIKQSDNNPYYTPFFMGKLARIYHAQGNHAAEVEVYQEIVDEYPTYVDGYGYNAKKLLERAKLEASAK